MTAYEMQDLAMGWRDEATQERVASITGDFSSMTADPQGALQEATRSSTSGAGSLRTRRLLIAGEVALAIVLLTGAGLMLKSFWRMNSFPPGFAPHSRLDAEVRPEVYTPYPRSLFNRLTTLVVRTSGDAAVLARLYANSRLKSMRHSRSTAFKRWRRLSPIRLHRVGSTSSYWSRLLLPQCCSR